MVTLDLPKELEEDLQELAEARGKSLNNCILDILRDFGELEDRAWGELASQAMKEDSIGHEESIELLNRIQNA